MTLAPGDLLPDLALSDPAGRVGPLLPRIEERPAIPELAGAINRRAKSGATD